MSEATIVSSECTDLIPSISIDNLLQQREAILSRYDKIREIAVELKGLYAGFHQSYPPSIEWEHHGQHVSFINNYRDNVEEQRKRFAQSIDQMAWDHLMKMSGNLELMDAKAKDDWHKSVSEYKFPELTYENIKATFTELHSKRGEMFNRGVIRVFEGLSWDYKTNSPFKFGKKIIVGYMSGYYPNCGGPKLDDLIRVFRVLDKKPEIADFNQTIQSQCRGTFGKTYPYFVENEYVKIKIFGNDNGHVEFKRMDLVRQLNEIVFRAYPFHIPQDNKAA